MVADISPSNTAPMKEERFEKFRKWINVLKPPEGKKLTQFATFQILRKRIYNWIKKCKNRQKQISAGKISLAKWEGSWEILYDLIIMNKLPDPDRSTSNKVLETLSVEKERKILNDSNYECVDFTGPWFEKAQSKFSLFMILLEMISKKIILF